MINFIHLNYIVIRFTTKSKLKLRVNMTKNLNTALEWGGAILSIAYSVLIASNTGFEVLSFVFFLLVALLLFTLAIRKRMWGWTTMQSFYIVTGAYGIWSWSV